MIFIKMRIGMTKNRIFQFNNIWKDQNITLDLKINTPEMSCLASNVIHLQSIDKEKRRCWSNRDIERDSKLLRVKWTNMHVKIKYWTNSNKGNGNMLDMQPTMEKQTWCLLPSRIKWKVKETRGRPIATLLLNITGKVARNFRRW